MPWRQVYLNRSLTDNEIIDGLASLFQVKTEQIKLSKENTNWLAVTDDSTRVACVVFYFQGSFPVGLDIIPLETTRKLENDLEAVGTLCESLNCHAVFWGNTRTLNPYVAMYIKGRNRYQLVLLDPEKLDQDEYDREEIEIKEYRETIDSSWGSP